NGARPIAYLWARTVRCESPSCGAEIPLVRSFWLCKTPNRKYALRPAVRKGIGNPPRTDLEIFQPQNEAQVKRGTVRRAKATCLCCNSVLPPERVRAQLRGQRGGAEVIFDKKGNRTGGARMLAVVTQRRGESRSFRLPTPNDYAPCLQASKELENRTRNNKSWV